MVKEEEEKMVDRKEVADRKEVVYKAAKVELEELEEKCI